MNSRNSHPISNMERFCLFKLVLMFTHPPYHLFSAGENAEFRLRRYLVEIAMLMGLQTKESQTRRCQGHKISPSARRSETLLVAECHLCDFLSSLSHTSHSRVKTYHGALNGIPVLAIACGHFCIPYEILPR